MSHASYARSDVTTFCGLDELGLRIVGQQLAADRAVSACRVVSVAETDQWCQRYGCPGIIRDSVTRRLAHDSLGWRPTTLLVSVRRYQCGGC